MSQYRGERRWPGGLTYRYLRHAMVEQVLRRALVMWRETGREWVKAMVGGPVWRVTV